MNSNKTNMFKSDAGGKCNRSHSMQRHQLIRAQRQNVAFLIDGVSGLQNSCHVILATSTPLALNKARKGEGRGKELTRLISNHLLILFFLA
jgi:hypothetical protein